MADNFDGARFLRRTLWVILALSLAGVAFSGTLTYRELRGTVAACPSVGTPGTIFGYPACVYGLAFYTALALLAGFALARSGKAIASDLAAGMPFSGGPATHEERN